MNYGTVHLMETGSKRPFLPPGGYGASDPVSDDRVKQQILDFLDGKTHGEELLHSLHDDVLNEPIPERMLALFRQPTKPTPEPE